MFRVNNKYRISEQFRQNHRTTIIDNYTVKKQHCLQLTQIQKNVILMAAQNQFNPTNYTGNFSCISSIRIDEHNEE